MESIERDQTSKDESSKVINGSDFSERHSREHLSASTHGDHDQVAKQLDVSHQKIQELQKEVSVVGFDAGVLSCLEYLESAPWAEHEEEKVESLLYELLLHVDVVEQVAELLTKYQQNKDRMVPKDHQPKTC